MLYLEYEDFKAKYLETQRKYDEILSEKEELFQRTQPTAMNIDKERVSGGTKSNPFESYLIAKEKKQIDERLAEVKGLLDDREKLLNLKLEELRYSNAIEDKIYRMRHIDRIRIYKIARMVNYSEAQVYRILANIAENIKMRENERFSMVQ